MSEFYPTIPPQMAYKTEEKTVKDGLKRNSNGMSIKCYLVLFQYRIAPFLLCTYVLYTIPAKSQLKCVTSCSYIHSYIDTC